MPLYVVTLQITAVPDDAAPSLRRHERYLARLAKAGRLRAAGEFRHDDGVLEIFEADDRLHAEATVREHPLVEDGVAAWTLRELLPRHGLTGTGDG